MADKMNKWRIYVKHPAHNKQDYERSARPSEQSVLN